MDWRNIETPEGVKSFIMKQELTQSKSILFSIASFKPGEEIYLQPIDSSGITVKIKTIEVPVTDQVETVFLEENYLIYSGTHSINKK